MTQSPKSGWQPIETAPRDGAEVLVCDVEEAKPYTIARVSWRDDEWRYRRCIERIDFVPEFWMPVGCEGNPFHAPLPEPPEAGA